MKSLTCINSKFLVDSVLTHLDYKRQRPWLYSISLLLWTIVSASCGKKTYITCNTKLLKVCSLNGNVCSGFEARFLIKPYKLLCIQVREVCMTFLFNLHISTIGASNKTTS